MKKLVLSVSISLLIISPSNAADGLRSVKLENSILKMIDGETLGINGENVALTKKYQSNILDILLGLKTKNGRQGSYQFDGETYNAQELREIESTLGGNATTEQRTQLQEALRKMRNDFEKISEAFREQAKASKPIIAILIEESCKKRNRNHDSLILIWSKSNENEYTLFDRHVRTIKDFEVFMTDLYNFLGDLVSSCPIAQRQFKERVATFGKIRKLMPSLSLTPQQQQRFLQYVQKQLGSLTVNSITPAKMKELYAASK